MTKRIVVLALWFCVGWTLGGFLSWSVGSPDFLGPLLGSACAAAVTLNPKTSVLTLRSGGAVAGQAPATPSVGEP